MILPDKYDYEAFGALISQTGATANSYLYAGEQLDGETGNYYLRARYMTPGLGFTQMDQFHGFIIKPLSQNKYIYGNNNPITYTDPSGRFGIGSSSAASHIVGTLANLQLSSGVDTAFALLFPDPDSHNTSLAIGASFIAVGGGLKLFKLARKSKSARLAPALRSTEGVVRRSILDSKLLTHQEVVFLPKIEKFAKQMLEGVRFPPIKVDSGVIVDGHHRYIAAKITRTPIDVVPGTLPGFRKGLRANPIADISFSSIDPIF